MDEKDQIEDEILRYFYRCWETGVHGTIHSLFPILKDISPNLIERIGEELNSLGYLRGLEKTLHGELTSSGIIEVENRGLIPREKIERNGHVRYRILEVAAKAYTDPDTNRFATFEDFDGEDEPDGREVRCNSDFLEDLRMIEFHSEHSFAILPRGLDQFKNWSDQKRIFRKWKEIELLEPHARGIVFQKLIGEVLQLQGYPVKEGLRRSHEEIDIVTTVDVPYLVECKWEKGKIGASVVREVFGKISNRAEVRGMIFSMSGFTDDDKGAVSQVAEYASQKYILLFGPSDIQRVIGFVVDIRLLIDEKLNALMWRKVVIWE